MKLASDCGGEGSQLLILLHGLGATRQVWEDFLVPGRWHGRWIAPDLRGHGASPHETPYSLETHAADVAELVSEHSPADDAIVLGHSMGGAVALALASGGFGFLPVVVFGLGIKVAWSVDECAGLEKMAHAPVRTFLSKEEAVARYLKVSGLGGIVQPKSLMAEAGVAKTQDGWRLACDPQTASVGPPPMQDLMDAARTPTHLACGNGDTLTNVKQLGRYDPDARTLPGGHNIMVENPVAVWDWIESFSPRGGLLR